MRTPVAAATGVFLLGDNMVAENEYTCEACKGVFTKGWSDGEAAAESRVNFGDLPKDDMAIICDDCYRALMAPRNAADWPVVVGKDAGWPLMDYQRDHVVEHQGVFHIMYLRAVVDRRLTPGPLYCKTNKFTKKNGRTIINVTLIDDQEIIHASRVTILMEAEELG